MVNYVFTLENFEYFLLILVRVTCFVYVAPLLGQQGIPNQIKIGFSFFVSLLLYNVVDEPELNITQVDPILPKELINQIANSLSIRPDVS